ncbi:putative ATP binding protein [Tripterygium wilfordii]|uniref:Putative ATP binding protein n=1 Tax=Tripterygium wilfordii TaxID=458696 RepID=A0A7J7D841_TRIWF|nr:putative serine/threonine-protein kinase [Tripterygium wilfordii]KAF5742535.1 putative ATP binding protein [Tripterygium wilfordii]
MKFLSKCFSFPTETSTDHKIIRGQQICPSTVHAFSYKQLQLATNHFHSSNKIGDGGFGSVYKGRLEDGRLVAVKVFSIESRKGDEEFMAEIASVSDISHENLVRLHGGCIDGPSRIIVYDYMENNNLAQTLHGGEKIREKINWKIRREICLGIARGLTHIHEEVKPHIVHRDIKARNVLLDHKFVPKLSDFGLSKLFSDNITHISTRVAGTLGYLAPEYAISGHLSRKSDMYSFGVLLLEIVSGRTAVDFDIQLGEHYLVQKAWDMYQANKLEELVDPTLTWNSSDIIEAVLFLKVGLLCVQQKCRRRPSMCVAVKMMRDEIDINDVQISEPGLITNIMDVKIGRKTSSLHNPTVLPHPL